MITATLCLTLRGQVPAVENCLRSCCRCFDEIVVADAGASGEAGHIARRFADRYFHYDWNGDCAAARNFAFSKASCDYIMWLDPEDVLLPADERRLWRLRHSLPPDTDAVVMRHDIGFDTQGYTNVIDWPVRMVRRQAGLLWRGRVSPRLAASDVTRQADVVVTRRGEPPAPAGRLAAYEAMRAAKAPFSSADRLDFARTLRDVGRMAEAAAEFEIFLQAGGETEDCIETCFELSFCYERMGDRDRTADALFRSLRFAPPRAPVCCRIGELFFAKEAWKDAAFWYDLALKSAAPPAYGVQYTDYQEYIPALQLCLCHYRMGDVRRAAEMNRVAARSKPRDKSVLANETFFADQLHHAQESE